MSATETAKLTASDGAASDHLGQSVAVSGDTVVVGADGDDVGTNANQGSAYVFVKPGGGWVSATETEKLTASDGAVNDLFGTSVAVSGDTVVVGSPGASGDRGAAYVFGEGPPPVIAAPQLSAVAEGSEVGVFGRNPDNELWYRETTSGTFGAWTKLSTSTNVASRPKAVMVGSDLYVFFRSTANDLRYFKRTGGTWGTEQNLGGVIAGSPAAAVDGDGDLIVAVRTSAGVVFFNRLPSGGSWTGFSALDGIIPGQLELAGYSGNVHLFGVDPSGLVWFRMWSAAANTWGVWTTLNGVIESSLSATVLRLGSLCLWLGPRRPLVVPGVVGRRLGCLDYARRHPGRHARCGGDGQHAAGVRDEPAGTPVGPPQDRRRRLYGLGGARRRAVERTRGSGRRHPGLRLRAGHRPAASGTACGTAPASEPGPTWAVCSPPSEVLCGAPLGTRRPEC